MSTVSTLVRGDRGVGTFNPRQVGTVTRRIVEEGLTEADGGFAGQAVLRIIDIRHRARCLWCQGFDH